MKDCSAAVAAALLLRKLLWCSLCAVSTDSKTEEVTYMVLIGGSLHCRAAAALPEALLPSAGVTDCLAWNLSCIEMHTLQ